MLPRAGRLRKERDFRAVFARSQTPGRSAKTSVRSSPAFSVHLRRVPAATPDSNIAEGADSVHAKPMRLALRFGFTISKKVAKRAHDRNRIKRQLSEIARTTVIPSYTGISCFDCVVVARKPALDLDFAAMRSELVRLLSDAGISLAQPARPVGVCEE